MRRLRSARRLLVARERLEPSLVGSRKIPQKPIWMFGDSRVEEKSYLYLKPMTIVSANMAQRLGNPAARQRFNQWLRLYAPNVLLTQEPFKPSQTSRPELSGYRLVGTSPQISAWVNKAGPTPEVIEHDDRWHEIRFAEYVIHNIYLSPYSARERRELLLELAETLRTRKDENSVILADFNLAPQPEDGLFGGELSKFTKAHERKALLTLLEAGALTDVTCPGEDESREFTFERVQRGLPIRFRCDLCLMSTSLAGASEVDYDHSVRSPQSGFTDHSAIVVRLPAQGCREPEPINAELTSLSSGLPTRTEVCHVAAAYKTAIRRTTASQIAHSIWEQGLLKKLSIRSIMDFGCGFGEDVNFYRERGLSCDGFDPAPTFGFSKSPESQFDMVTVVFVINVLPSKEDRIAALRSAANLVRHGGYMLIAARSKSAVTRAAERGTWTRTGDGWISSPAKNTFQKGISEGELGWLLAHACLEVTCCSLRLSSDVSWVLGVKTAADPKAEAITG